MKTFTRTVYPSADKQYKFILVDYKQIYSLSSNTKIRDYERVNVIVDDSGRYMVEALDYKRNEYHWNTTAIKKS